MKEKCKENVQNTHELRNNADELEYEKGDKSDWVQLFSAVQTTQNHA